MKYNALCSIVNFYQLKHPLFASFSHVCPLPQHYIRLRGPYLHFDLQDKLSQKEVEDLLSQYSSYRAKK